MGRRAGRKRKSGQREPNGRLKPEKRPDDRVKTSRQPHRRALPDDMRLDERAESPLGRMNLRGEIDADCYDAGARYAFVVGQYASTIEAPRSTAGSGRGSACAVESEAEAELPTERRFLFARANDDAVARGSCWKNPETAPACAARIATWRPMRRSRRPAGGADGGQSRRGASRRARSAQETVYLVAGLSALARHFGLTTGRPRPYRRNAN
jgi:hypothetical protein